MILWPILFITLALADEEYSIEEYCFTSPSRMQAVNSKSKIVFVPSDVVSLEGSCLTVKARSHRRELIQAYIRNVEPDVSIKFSSAEIRRELCNLKVEKIKKINQQNIDVKIEKTGAIDAGQQTAESKEVSSISTLNNFELTVNQDTIKGNCRYITPERYEISIEVRKDAKPLFPGLASQTTVILNNPPPPPDQETALLKTTIQIEKGQRIELGGIIKDLKNKNSKVDINPSVAHEETQGSIQETVYLSLP